MRLVVSFTGKKMHFLDLRIKSYGCLKFQGEVRAYAPTNEKELITCAKNAGQEKKIQEKWVQPDKLRRRPTGRYLNLSSCTQFFEIFYLKKKNFLEVWEMGQGFCENGCTVHAFFQACPYTWKC
jgi:hypothetical protein